ncbi:MAG TPA: helicase C-terminal domain-containing protein [Ktedonobacterales bacterium]
MQTEEAATLRETVEADLREGGVISQSLAGYEDRPAQISMARDVADALESGEHLVVEAGTGTGTSIAYLLPIVRSGKVALVSTANKALQEQLFYKDIPFLQQHVQQFPAALVKGMGNYLCLDRLTEERNFQQLVKHRAFAKMEALIDDSDDWDGDLDLLPESLPSDTRARVAADSEQCAWRACPFYGDCYVRKMRERSREAQVIVVNHTLLLLDAAMGGFLLPERDVVVIDEAHHLEEEVTRAFTATVTPGRIRSLLSLNRVREHVSPQVQQEATEADVRAWSALQNVIQPNSKGRQLLVQPLEEGLRLASAIEEVANGLMLGRPDNQDDKEEQLYEKVVKRARTLASDLRIVFGVKQPKERVYYVEQVGGQGRRAPQPSVSAAPLDVTELLREKLFDRINTVATSATLAVNGDFRFFRTRVGLPAGREAVLPLAFDYKSNALLYVPHTERTKPKGHTSPTIREPAFGAENALYLSELAEQMRLLVEASEGRAFLLFSSQHALRTVFDILADLLETQGYSLLVQGRDVSRVEMVRQFRELPRAVLFGLKSFWEGVDVAGEALSLVAIDKLPFDPPDDPVNEARVAQMREAGENWFGDYVLPQAILRLKQGIGRLLRTRDDRGVLAILDTRLRTKGYGRQVILSLPPASGTADIAAVQRFFDPSL